VLLATSSHPHLGRLLPSRLGPHSDQRPGHGDTTSTFTPHAYTTRLPSRARSRPHPRHYSRSRPSPAQADSDHRQTHVPCLVKIAHSYRLPLRARPGWVTSPTGQTPLRRPNPKGWSRHGTKLGSGRLGLPQDVPVTSHATLTDLVTVMTRITLHHVTCNARAGHAPPSTHPIIANRQNVQASTGD
jgi:hypothetical protein